MPPHLGHLRLIEFGSKRCDQLIVALCSRPHEPIPGQLRHQWMKELLKKYPNTKLIQIKANLPWDSESSRRASRIWCKYLAKRLRKIDIIFSSEFYGDYLAEYMKVRHQMFDLKRKQVNVSGTKIRLNPFKYWEYLPEIVRPYYVKKVCVYGPESTGKSTLARQLAEHYETTWVPEFARGHIASQGNKFNYEDIKKVGWGQLATEQKGAKIANKFLFCDTDSITTTIYSRHYFGKCPRFIRQLANQPRFDLYLFTDIDLVWKKDELRDLGHRRQEFKKRFENELIKRNQKYVMISGSGQERLATAIRAVNEHFESNN